ncbi:hypothetical protein [Escherichia coli]|uniref:hypothetical protein n=1 Tax=Escherichia coli TaxID=562 RepID=UPI000B490D8E|nr:hypothetical protein [Escherichia coli]OWG44788.1 hypothetical protein CCE24_08920 [Escherichia coli]OWG98173.1 hypothetical protein CCE15_08915 [Escherichia coli]OWH16383.1 hypothetical protein CCE22_08920 [Escherichia coli]OWH21948.1 hypothetical protein CCE09_26330 [Escherichia coli]
MNNKKNYELIKKSLENEMNIDSYLIESFNLKTKWVAFFKVARFKDKIPTLFTIPLLLALPFYFLFQVLKSLRSQHVIPELNGQCIFLSFTESSKIIGLYREYGNAQPFKQCVLGRTLLFLHEICMSDLIKAYFISFAYSVRFLVSVHPRYYLHMTSIFELVSFSYYLDKLHRDGIEEITLTNHYDRWITLICEKDFFSVNVIQHGLLAKEFVQKHKLHNLKTVRGINEEQLNIYSSNVAHNTAFKKLFLKANLDIIEDDFCDVLIISNPFYIAEELKIYQDLKSHSVDVKFRPHPIYITSEIQKIVHVNDLCKDKRLPNPTYCLCKSSTLGYEYEAMGYPLIPWDDKIEIDKILVLLGK